MKPRLTLTDKISATVITVGIFCILLVLYISSTYKQLAYRHHEQSIQQLTMLEINELIENLKTNSLDLAMAIEHEKNFMRDVRLKHKDDLTRQLDNQFHQYFVTAGVLKLLKLYVLDTNFTLLSYSTEGIHTNKNSELICPQLSQIALSRTGPARLKTLQQSCLFKNKPVYSVIVPFGGLNPKGYIQVVTDLAYNLQNVAQALAMPVQMSTVYNQILYQSEDWQSTLNHESVLDVMLPIYSDDKKHLMTIIMRSDMTVLNEGIAVHRDRIMGLTVLTTGLIVIIVLLILRKSAIPPLSKIHDVLEKIHTYKTDDIENDRVLFKQLLEQIIKIRRKNGAKFSVMILDLNHFEKVNVTYGNETGDMLLLEVEHRLSSVIRGTDMISWVGTDTPGHKLLPADTKTRYRATIARLGGDEFGLLLPSAETPEEANVVAERIVETFNKPFQINSHRITIDCKIGISIYPHHGQDESLLIRNADKAMHQAKTLKKTVFVYVPDTNNTDSRAA
jgi:GGDEF domain-containing protein